MILLFKAQLMAPRTPKEFWNMDREVGETFGARLEIEKSVTLEGEEVEAAIKEVNRLVVHTLRLADISGRQAVTAILAHRLREL